MLGGQSVKVDEITLLGLAFIGLAFKWKFFSQACACRCQGDAGQPLKHLVYRNIWRGHLGQEAMR